MDANDRPSAVRPGEGLPLEALEACLKRHLPGAAGPLTAAQYPSGFSNLTYLLNLGGREVILRRPPFGTKAKSAHDMAREFRILEALHPVFPYCPRPLLYLDDPAVMETPFYLMAPIRGIILRKRLPPGLVLDPGAMRALCENLLDVQLALHAVDCRAVGLQALGRPEGYVQRQVDGWTARYAQARTPDAPDFAAVVAWLRRRMPPDAARAAIVHNDFKFDNVVLDPADALKIIGVLDWEMATVGDPLMDLGCSLAYWVEAQDPPELQAIRMSPTHLPGAPTRRELVARYVARSGLAPAPFAFYRCFGLFRLAVIAQQIYYRYYHRQTADQRFASLIFAVQILEKTALEEIRGA
jgi:aminoglycoside phosphotransferase (APT) family kinase protein